MKQQQFDIDQEINQPLLDQQFHKETNFSTEKTEISQQIDNQNIGINLKWENLSAYVFQKTPKQNNEQQSEQQNDQIQQQLLNQIQHEDLNKATKQIVYPTSGYVKKGELLAIMGPSGAGKTTLLSLLAKRVKQTKQFKIDGETFFNDETYDMQKFSQHAAFIQQQDLLRDCLTVRETIYYSAKLKTKGNDSQINALVDKIIKQLQLQNCQDTFVGGVNIKGVSGGERKRTCIGLELISNPQVLVLDEPTSGLDSYTAWLVIHTLKQLALKQNKTIIVTIHQPSQDIVELFDRLILMRKGNVVYQGPLSELNSYATDIGVQINQQSNQIEFFMNLLQKEETDFNLTAENYRTIIHPKILKEIDLIPQGSQLQKNEQINSFKQELIILLSRQFKNNIRNFRNFWAKVSQVLFTSFFFNALWSGTGNIKNIQFENQSDLTVYLGNMTGLCFIINVNILMAIVTQNTMNFPKERPIFIKEFNAGYFRIGTYYLVKILIELPLLFLIPAILTFLTYFCIDLHHGRSQMQYIILVCGAFVGHGLGFINGTVFKNERIASAMGSMIMMPMMLFSGFIQNKNNLQDWTKPLQYLSPINYMFQGQLEVQSNGTVFQDYIRETFGVQFEYWENVGIVIGFAVALHVLAFFILKFQGKNIAV